MSQLNLTLMLSSMADWSSNSVAAGGAPSGHHPSNTAVISSGNYPQTAFQSGSSSYQSPNHNPHHQNAHASSSYYSQLMDLLQRYNQSRNFSTSAGGTGSGGSGSGSFLNFSQIDLLNELLTNRGNGNHSSISSFTGGADAAQLGQLHLLTNSVVKGGSANFEEEDFENTSSGDVLPILLCVIYAAICLLGVAGNGLVFFSVARNPAMHSVTNVFISNLAFSDILLSLFAVPITPLYLLVYRAWHFGAVLCHLLPFAQGASIYISAFTLMSIAIDRYQVIMYPLRARMKMNVCIGIILAIWLVTAVITSPYAYYMKLVEIGGSGGGGGGGGEEFVMERGDPLLEAETETEVMEVTEPIVLYCDEQWPGDSVRLSYTVLTSILQFVVPLLIIGFCYTKVCGKLWDRTKSIPGSVSARREEQERERARRTNTMLICMVVCFVLSWAGLNIYNLLMDFVKLQHNTTAFLVLHVIAMSSVIYNPILYGVLNENFRKEFKAILPCLAALFTSSSSSASELHPAHGNHHHPNDASSRRRSSYNTTAAAAAASASVSNNNNNNNNNNISTSSTNANANASLHNNSYNSSKRCVKLHLSAKKEEEEEASISGTSCSGGGKMAADKSSLISSEQMMQEPRAHHLGTTVVTTTAAAAAATKATRRADSPPANLRVNGDNRRADIGYYSCDGRLVANGKPPPLTELS